ncbi:MAG: 1-acylglycerol-3-phosphate O-acyltransferase [Chromatiaceae bacterium]|nr:1-acylglycerol-3-phosphate O-acyltransferase [Chromatiaceae bacterium]
MQESQDNSDALVRILEEFARESGLPLPEDGIGLDIRLEADLGLDSLARSELLSRVEKGLGASLPEQALLAATPRDLLALVDTGGEAQSAKEGPAVQLADGKAVAEAARIADKELTLMDTLDWHLEDHPERVHILYQGSDEQAEPITYRNLEKGAAGVAGGLVREGLRPGDRVALMLPTGPGYFFSFFGILYAGGIPVPIYPPARPQQIEDHLRRHARILNNAGISFLITVPEARAVGRLLGVQVPSMRGLLTLDTLDAQEPLEQPHRADPGEIAFLQYTSGSTGDPKGVILTHADLLANIRAMGTAVGADSEDIFVSWLPLYHDMGLIGAWLGSLYFGMPLIAMSPLAFLAKPLRWLQAIDRHRGTLSAAPNFAYELCLTRIPDAALESLDLSSWRWAFNGAEPVSPQTLRRFAQRFAPCGLRREAIAPVYGLAEAAVGLAFPPAGRGPRIDCIDRRRFAQSGHALQLSRDDPTAMEVVACGRPLPGYRVRVVDEYGRQLPERHEGLLQFQGPSATRGYYANPDATARLIRGGWHDTGDRAYLASGDIHLTGRVKDLIIRGGRNIYPYELEQAVGEIPGVRRGCVAAFAAADPKTGSERLVVVAETRERDPGRRKKLEQAVRERASDILDLPPDEVVLAPPRAVLKTSSGKLRRGGTRDLYLAGRLLKGPTHPLWQLARVGLTGLGAGVARLIRLVPSYLYGGYAWILLGLIGPVIALGVLALPRLAWRWRLARGGISLLRRLAFIQLEVSGLEQVPVDDRPFVLVSNHQSYLDAFALIEAIPRPLGFVAKRELQPVPLIGRMLARMGTLFVERFDLQRSAAESGQITAALERGETLAFFPEGTLREDAGLLPFRMGAFTAAAQTGLSILPVALRGTRMILRGESRLPRRGAVQVSIGPTLAPTGTDWQAGIRLRDQARAFVLDHCAEPDSKRYIDDLGS